MNVSGEWAREQLAILDEGWDRLMGAIERWGAAGLDRPLSAAWTVKEMFAHLAFWEETSLPVIECMYRGKPEIPVDQWYGGDDLGLGPNDPWPDTDTHNAREAQWARSRNIAEVIERLMRARQNLKSVIATITDEEARGSIGEQWSAAAICDHIDRHLARVDALPAAHN